MDVTSNIASEGEKKSEHLNAFLISVFNSQTSYGQSTEPCELEDQDGEQHEASEFRRKWLATCRSPVLFQVDGARR